MGVTPVGPCKNASRMKSDISAQTQYVIYPLTASKLTLYRQVEERLNQIQQDLARANRELRLKQQTCDNIKRDIDEYHVGSLPENV